MTTLTDTLSFDEWLPLEQQPETVQRLVYATLQGPPDQVINEDCGGGLQRPTRHVWYLGRAELVRLPQYQHPATHTACFAGTGFITVLRPQQPQV